MKISGKRTIVGGAIVALAVAGTGGAIAATKLGSPREESAAIVNDAAKQLGVQPDKLSAALKKALANRVDAAVAAGRITKAEGDAMKARISSDEFPLFGKGGGHGHHHGGHGHHPGGPGHAADLAAAAAYLGLTDAQLRTELSAGKTLADVAKAQGKSVDGLVSALVAATTKKIDAEVAAGRLTQAQATAIKADLKARITDRVNGARPKHGPGHGPRGPRGHGFGPPPGAGFVPAPSAEGFAPTI